MPVTISRSLLDRLVAAAGAAAGEEICGLLVGREGAIEEAWPVANAAPDPRTGFLLDPEAHLAAARRARAEGRAILGHFHSHPSGDLTPSAADAALAGEEGRLWLILGAENARLWISRRGGPVQGAFLPARLEIRAERLETAPSSAQ
ncbi:MAG: Mov34/MPN/PAD-1 family protein [Allosphingosinicella sp.]|uniref:Mov34/MPN/PAD-1 family protein n=1 Tax=Allosphingosinicella sp. TaxID=2823234 RepID=UPI003949C61F